MSYNILPSSIFHGNCRVSLVVQNLAIGAQHLNISMLSAGARTQAAEAATWLPAFMLEMSNVDEYRPWLKRQTNDHLPSVTEIC